MFDQEKQVYSFLEHSKIPVYDVPPELLRAVSESLEKYIRVTRDLFQDRYYLEASNYVGSFSAGGVQFQINPKIPVNNLFYIISKVYDLVEVKPLDQLVHLSASYELIEYLLRLLLEETERLLRQGLFSRYLAFCDRLNVIRGKLIMKTLAQRSWDISEIECAFHEYTPDVLENQLVLSALNNAAKIPTVRIFSSSVSNVINKLWAVSDRKLTGKDVDKVIFNRLNNRYKKVLTLARFFLDNIGLKDESGGQHVRGFFIDMNKLFEKYVERLLKEKQWGNIQIKTQHSEQFARQPDITVKPDIIFFEDDLPRLIIDVKYKRSNKPSSEDIYQMNAYADQFDTDVVLVYPTDEVEEKEYYLPKGRKLYVRYLNLGGACIFAEEGRFLTRISELL
ncbi:MAG TPA: hypothetical protein DCE14_04695 [Kosmotogaceae bacterium]|nr:hypothetical protein [Kosmotogaceae bacterium]